jgi:O-antigen ligase
VSDDCGTDPGYVAPASVGLMAPEGAPSYPAGMTQRTRIAAPGRLSAWLLFATTALAPLPFGSNTPTAIAFWCIVLGTCLVFAPVRSLNTSQLALAGLAGIVVVAYALVLYVQLSAQPWFAAPYPIWHEAAAALGVPLSPSISIARNQPWFELGRPLVCMLAIGCGFLVGTDRGRARQLLKVIAWSGSAYAMYGILAHLIDPTHILWREKEAYLPYVTGAFINHNTAAAYFGSCAVVWSLLLWERVRLEMPRGPLQWRTIPSSLLSSPPTKIVVAFANLFLCLAAMFMTGSRGGVVLSLLALIVAFTAFFRRDLPRRSGLVNAIAGGGAVALILLQFMGAGINARFDIQGASDEGRLETYRSTLRMIADHPWFGTGQGTFAYAFPAYRSPNISMWGVWDIAHNTLLEIASDMGIPIATLVVVAWIVVFAVLIRGASTRRRDLVVPVAALSVAILGVLHSLIDFTLQIPGYAIVAMALIGTGLAQSLVASGDITPQKSGILVKNQSRVNTDESPPAGDF